MSADEPRFALVTYEPQRIRGNGGSWRWVPGWEAQAHRPTWRELCRSMTRFRRAAEKLRVWSWSPVVLEGTRRRNDAVQALSCVVLDLDDGQPLRDVSARFSSWPHIVHTTWSHTPTHPKGRLILPLEEPIPVKWWPRAWQWAQRQAGQTADEQAKDPSRLYFLPAGPHGAEGMEAWVHDPGGYLLDLRPWEDLPITPQERPLPPMRWRGGVGRTDRARAEALKVDPSERAALALALGGRVQGGYARGVRCPACGRPSAWWPIEPGQRAGWACSHARSCGAYGWLDELEG